MRADVSRGEYMHMHVMYTSISGIGVKKHHSDQKKIGSDRKGRKEGRQAGRHAGRQEGRKEGRTKGRTKGRKH